ncbi:WG repeat-containing protein [Hymenobacter sp. 5516J-16]|uniref:WG repeat-containing protein n=1 Tax=Hymenobacter sp. 5516J-16 TaxID=2932253 RepID=UPI001FD1333E|nr:WG repeat-containing protein [Hymenobacter sp. 5516J-16]UOQ78894.1 WG repeat-containing protein [Hymenobacter sp. 5516J-16]
MRKEGKVGFRFTVGSGSVPALYDEIRENYNGLLFVRQGSKWGVIDSRGKLVQPVRYDAIRLTSNLMFPVVQLGQLFGYLDEEGNTLTEIRYPRPSLSSATWPGCWPPMGSPATSTLTARSSGSSGEMVRW